MAGYVCTIAGGNGGVGKTVTAIELGAALEATGLDTVVVDADLGMPNVASVLGVSHEASLHDILGGRSTVSETLTSGPGGMTIIPGTPALEAYADADPKKLRSVIRTLRRAFDVVLVDTAAGLREENTVLLDMADGVILLTTPDHVSLTDTDKTGQLATRVDSDIIGSLLVRVTDETPLADLDNSFSFPVLGGIPSDEAVQTETPAVLNAPDSVAADAYRGVAEQLERVIVEGASGDDLEMVRVE